MLVSRVENEELKVIDRHKEMIRLAGGLDKDNNLSEAAQLRALDCLQRMGHRLRNITPENKRVVGTNTLRKSRNASAFIEKAEAVLGCEIDIISGREEARLLYMGVAHSLSSDKGKRLVCDIGGGSTEIIIGEGFEPGIRVSLHMGCVSMTRKYFPEETINERNWRNAVTHARLEFHSVMSDFTNIGWEAAYGASGTFRSVQSVLLANGWSHSGITWEGLKQLKQAILQSEDINQLTLEGLSDQRQPVFVGGAAIVFALFKTFKIESAGVASSALREGVVYDLAGKQYHDDIRERTITHLLDRFNVDKPQSELVSEQVVILYHLMEPSHLLEKDHINCLIWSSRLHEIGLCVAHGAFHKHGAYILAHADMPGFSQKEQDELAFLIRAQRKKYPLERLDLFRKKQQQRLLPMSILLRLALLFSRNRTNLNTEVRKLEWDADKQIVSLDLSYRWLDEHPLYVDDLFLEQKYLNKIGVTLLFL